MDKIAQMVDFIARNIENSASLEELRGEIDEETRMKAVRENYKQWCEFLEEDQGFENNK